jgi:bisphosphoglycerate-dependent phosphoglycerate mutase
MFEVHKKAAIDGYGPYLEALCKHLVEFFRENPDEEQYKLHTILLNAHGKTTREKLKVYEEGLIMKGQKEGEEEEEEEEDQKLRRYHEKFAAIIQSSTTNAYDYFPWVVFKEKYKKERVVQDIISDIVQQEKLPHLVATHIMERLYGALNENDMENYDETITEEKAKEYLRIYLDYVRCKLDREMYNICQYKHNDDMDKICQKSSFMERLRRAYDFPSLSYSMMKIIKKTYRANFCKDEQKKTCDGITQIFEGTSVVPKKKPVRSQEDIDKIKLFWKSLRENNLEIVIPQQQQQQRVVSMNEHLQSTLNLQQKFTETDNLNGCKLGYPNLKITKVLSSIEKLSSSTSIVCEGTAFEEKEEVMVKISFDAKRPDKDNSLQIESDIYEKIVPLLSIHTPNLMSFLATGKCNNFKSEASLTTFRGIMGIESWRVFIEEVNEIRRGYNRDKLNMVVTKKAKGKKLMDWLMNPGLMMIPDLFNFIKDILLQIAYTLVNFEDFGLMHHDLHVGNVFVEELSTPLRYSVNVGEKIIVRDIKYFVQIYDFDHSMKVSTEYNDTILHNNLLDTDFCLRLGECNRFYKSMDWFTILHSMYMVRPSTPLVSELVDKDLLKGIYKSLELAFMGRPCTCPKNESNCTKCTPINLDKEGLIQSPLQYLLGPSYESCITHCEPTFHRVGRPRSKNE